MAKKGKNSARGQRSGRVTPKNCEIAPVEVRSLRVDEVEGVLPSGMHARFGVIHFRDPGLDDVDDLVLQIAELIANNHITFRVSLSRAKANHQLKAFVEGDEIMAATSTDFADLIRAFQANSTELCGPYFKQARILRHVESYLCELSQLDNNSASILVRLLNSNNPPQPAIETARILVK